MSDAVHHISKKKILYVDIDEEITSIFKRIEPLPYGHVYLVVPRRAILLQSIVNLKILKQKLDDIGKEYAIITNDANGMKLAHQAEIKVYDHWDLDGDDTVVKADEEVEQRSMLKPIQATSNDIEEDLPTRLPKKKSSIFEIVRGQRGEEQGGFSLVSYLKDRKKNRLKPDPLRLYLSPSAKRTLSGMALASVVIFFLIVYVALPGATLSIEPASNVVTKAVNVTLERVTTEPRSLTSYPVETTVEFTISHSATGILSEGSDASGLLTVINTSGAARPFIDQTRFQTEEGLVFRIQEAVTVPTGTEESPGTLEVFVLADEVDANGVPTGDRGNIGPSRFIIPGLSEGSQVMVYGESYAPMGGGETVVSALVQEEDLIAARDKLEIQLEEKALSALRKVVLSEGANLGLNLALLEDSDVLQFDPALIELPYELVGQNMAQFEVTGSMTLSGVAFDQDGLVNILRTEIISAETPGKQLVRIEEDSISIEVINVDNSSYSYRFTAQIQGIEEYEIDPDLEGGSKLAKKIIEHVVGQSIEDAISYIQNLPEVNKVEVKIWPVWSPTLPNLPENIKIESLSEGESVGETE
jgi:hypothetical protein